MLARKADVAGSDTNKDWQPFDDAVYPKVDGSILARNLLHRLILLLHELSILFQVGTDRRPIIGHSDNVTQASSASIGFHSTR